MSYGAFPYGGAAYGSAGLTPPVVDVASDGIAFGALAQAIAAARLADGLALSAVPASELIHRLLERIALTGTAVPTLDARPQLDESVAFADAITLVWQALAAEGIELAGSATSQRTLVAAVVDSLHATGTVASRLDAMAAVSAAIAINGMIAGGWKLEAIDSVEFQDALVAQLRALGKLVDSAGFTDTALPALRIVAVAADTLGVAADPATSLEAFALASDEVVLYATIRLGAAEFAGWVLSQGAAWEYRNYPFNGMVAVEAGGTAAMRYFGTAADGLYELAGDTDDGDPIGWRILTALQDFGTGKLKRVPDVYIAFAGGDTVVLKVITTGRRGERRTDVYTAKVPAGDALHRGRVKVGRGLASAYWQFELTNVDPTTGEVHDLGNIDALEFRPLVLDRRL